MAEGWPPRPRAGRTPWAIARVRDEIKAFIEQLPEALLGEKGEPR